MAFKILIILLLVVTCLSVEIPNTMIKCSRKDKHFNNCLTDALNKAFANSFKPVKKINLVTLDPLKIPAIVIPPGRGPVGFAQNFKNVTLTGISNVKCSKVGMNFNSKIFYLTATSPLVHLDFTYEFNGKILVLPIVGKGPGTLELHNVSIEINFYLDEIQKKGQKHYKVTKSSVSLNPGKLVFKLQNLFDGDKLLGDNINRVLNENWEDVFKDVKKGYDSALGTIFGSIFNNVLAKVSVEKMFG